MITPLAPAPAAPTPKTEPLSLIPTEVMLLAAAAVKPSKVAAGVGSTSAVELLILPH
jgi:hypothetical protein